jgi:hypothetical protein
MKLEELQQWIKENLLDSKNKINSRKLHNDCKSLKIHFPNEYEEVFNITSFLDIQNPSFNQRLYHIYNNIFESNSCKICNNITTYKNFTVGYADFCSLTCRNYGTKEQREQTCIEKYGYKHHLKNDNVQEKRKRTCIEKYGVDSFTKTDKIKKIISNKRKNETKEQKIKRDRKHEQTCIKNNGIGNQTNNIKRKQTCIKKYGVSSFSKTIEFKNKFKKTLFENLKKNILPLLINDIEKNTNHTILKCEVYNVRDKIKLKCVNDHIFYRNVNNLQYNKSCPLCDNNKSKAEIELSEFLKDFNCVANNKTIINPLELDIYLPNNNLAIEYDGIYWHSEENGKDRKYHLNKTKLCEEKGIQLLHIFENEWIDKKEIVKSIILSKIGIFKEKYFARKCNIKEIDVKTKNDFLNENHLQGKDKSSIKLGLFYENKLLSIMTFGKRKISGGESKFEMIRFCNKKNITVLGGASKLFNHFIKKYDFEEITTYADRRYSNGKFYEKIGFELSHISNPNYWYFKSGDLTLHNRINFQKHKLIDKLEFYADSLTEYENMLANDYNRIWDCGNYVYTYKNNR